MVAVNLRRFSNKLILIKTNLKTLREGILSFIWRNFFENVDETQICLNLNQCLRLNAVSELTWEIISR